MKHSIYLKSKPKRSAASQNHHHHQIGGVSSNNTNIPFSASPNRTQYKVTSPPPQQLYQQPPPVHPKSLSPSSNNFANSDSNLSQNIYYSTSKYIIKK